MAQVAFPLVGGVIGAIIGAPFGLAPLGFAIGSTLGGIAGSFFQPDLPDVVGSRLDSLDVTSAAYGTPVRFLMGTIKTAGVVDWSPGIIEHRDEEEIGGPQSGAPNQTLVTFTYTVSFGVTLCEGPVDAVLKIWRDVDLIYDAGNVGPTESGKAGTFRIYLGDEDQEPDEAEQADKGIDNTPAYRGVCRIVFEDHDITDIRRIPNIRALVARGTVATAFPVISVTGESSETSGLRFAPDGRRIMFGGRVEEVSLWDSVSQTQLLARTLQGANNSVFFHGGCFDSLGNFYATVTEVQTTGSVLKYDADTLALLAKTNDRNIGGGLIKGDMAQIEVVQAMGLPGFEMIVARGFSGQIYIIDTTPFGSTEHSELPRLNILRTIQPSDFDPGASGEGDVTLDDEGFAWCLTPISSTDTLLLRLSPTTGSVVEVHTIAGLNTSGIGSYLAYEETTHSLIIGVDRIGADSIRRWGIDSQTIEAGPLAITLSLAEYAVFQQGPTDGVMWFGTGATVQEVDVVNMEILRTLTVSSTWAGVSSATDVIYDPLSDAIVNNDTDTVKRWMFLERLSGGATTLKTVVDAVSDKVGLLPADIDTSALTESVDGVIADRRMPARAFLEPLAAAHFFRTVESDWLVKFSKRGQLSGKAIPEIDLGAKAGEVGEMIRLPKPLAHELTLAERIDITYAEAGSDYQILTQQAKRAPEAVGTKRRVTVNYPGVLSNDNAKQIVEKALFSEWTQRQGYELRLPMTYLLQDPADVVSATEGGETFDIELATVDIHAGGVIAARGFEDDDEVFNSTATWVDGGIVPAELVITGPSFWQLLDIPLLRDQDEGLCFYAAAGCFGTLAWPGLSILDSADGVNFSGVFASVPSSGNIVHGVAGSALPVPARGPYFLDRDSTLLVRLRRGTLSSVSFEALLDENVNVAIFGNGEIVQFQDAVLQGDGRYLLSNFVRGGRGTENRMADHAAQEFVVFPTATTLFRNSYGSERLNVERFYHGVTAGDPISQGTSKSLTAQGRSMKPYRPETFGGSISANDWTITFRRRPRIGNVSLTFSDMPVVENVLDFGLRVYDGATLVRTITTTASANGSVVTVSASQQTGQQSVFYDDADQVIDFGSVQTSLEVEAFQVGEFGEGEPSERITLQG